MVIGQVLGGPASDRIEPLAASFSGAAAPAAMERNLALDFTKGVLVLFMALYHWINYFVTSEGFFYRYLRFVTPSFIFLTGFLVANVYLVKYAGGEYRLFRRLAERGGKLIALFTLLNLGATLFARSAKGPQGIGQFLSNAYRVYVVGDNAKAVFPVLVPIAYLLVLSAVLVLAGRRRKVAFQSASAIGFGIAILAALAGRPIPNLELVTIGLLGVLAGYIPRSSLDLMPTHAWSILLAYVVYIALITSTGATFVMQIVAVCLTLMIVYMSGIGRDGSGSIGSRILRLGRYSLFSYIIQIVILQVLLRLLHPISSSTAVLVLSAVGTVTLMQLSVDFVDWGRGASNILDRTYRVVFM